MLIDVHTHLWSSNVAGSKKAILTAAEQYKISRLMVSTLNTLEPSSSEIHQNNMLTWEFMREHPELVSGYCYLNPRCSDSQTELKRCIEDRGFCGVKLWTATFCDDPAVNPIIESCIAYDIPVLIHAFYKSVNQLPYETLGQNVANLARRYPQAKLIMAHLGANCVRELRAVKNCSNVWADFSGSINHADDLRYAAKLLGTQRILFGTDMPIDFIISYSQVLEADFTEQEKQQILSENAKKLFKLIK